jgi:hypothetical protein
MNLINQHIRKHLLRFQDEEDAFFQEFIELIQSQVKEEYVLLLRYFHLLLDETFSEVTNDPKTLHLHFEYDLNDDSSSVIAQYLLIRFFIESSKTNVSSSNEGNLQTVKTKLKSRLNKLSTCPDGASGKNGGNRIYRNWIRDKKEVNTTLDFYNKLDDDTEISINAVFNCQVRLTNSLNDILVTRPYACKIENYNTYPTFNLLNTKSTLNEIDDIDNSIIDNLETVILFDCERKKLMQYFSLQDIKDYDINLKNYLILSLIKYRQTEVIKNKQLYFGQLIEEFEQGAFGTGHFNLKHQFLNTIVGYAKSLNTCVIAQSRGQKTFSHSCRSANENRFTPV